MSKQRKTIPTHQMSDELIDKLMVWLVAAINDCAIENIKQALINTLLFIEKERINHADKESEQEQLDKIFAKYTN